MSLANWTFQTILSHSKMHVFVRCVRGWKALCDVYRCTLRVTILQLCACLRMILLPTLSFGPALPRRSGEPTSDGTGDPKRAKCFIIGSCILLLQTLRFGDPLYWATDFGSGSVNLSDLDLWIKRTWSKQKQTLIFQYLKSCQTDHWRLSYEKNTFRNHLLKLERARGREDLLPWLPT